MSAPLASRLDQRIDLLALTTATSTIGEDEQTYALLRRVWAQVMEGKGREFVNGSALAGQVLVAFRVRYASDIEAAGTTLRIDWRGSRYEVTAMTGTRAAGELWLHAMSIGDAA